MLTPTPLDPADRPVALVAVSRTSRVPKGDDMTPSTVPRLVLDPDRAPGPEDPVDAVAVVYHPGLTPQERVAVTGPRTGNTPSSPFWLGLVGWVVGVMVLVAFVAATGVSDWWLVGGLAGSTVVWLWWFARDTGRWHTEPWERWLGPTLQAHARLLGSTVPPHGDQPLDADRVAVAVERWADLVHVATLPRPLAAPHPPRPAPTRGYQRERHWVTPTGPSGVPLSEARYVELVRRLVSTSNALAAAGGQADDPRHQQLWEEIGRIAADGDETVPRADYFLLVDPLPTW